MIKVFLGASLLAGAAPAMAQVPGIPEPPVIIYGTVTDNSTDQLLAITRVVWQVTDETDSATFNAVSSPPARILTHENKSFYLLEVPFETRVVQSGAGQTIVLDRNGQSMELKSSGAPCTFTTFINGRATEIRSVEGVDTGGTSLRLENSPATNGRIMRVDLKVSGSPAYVEWAAKHFEDVESPEAMPGADPDGDGVSNDLERQAGTNPKNSASVFRITGLITAETGAGFIITWHSISGKAYQVESSASLNASSWKVEATVTATDASASCQVSDKPEAPRKFYRITVVK